VDKDKKTARASTPASDDKPDRFDIDEFFRGLQSEGRTKPTPEAVAAAMEAAQRLAAEADAEDAANDVARVAVGDGGLIQCRSCGHSNRTGNHFCGMCGDPLPAHPPANVPRAYGPNSASETEPRPTPTGHASLETHHYHHHYHHHYFPAGYDGGAPRAADSRADYPREEKLRSSAALRGDMTRAEATVRQMTQEWVLACNTKHLDDVLEIYVPDALVLRSNYPPVRGVAAIREFFFGLLDSGLGEVELEPLRLDVVGDFAYEAGRCKALVPSAAGKRREERGKYLWVFARQSNGEWKLAADCWSSDLTLSALESDVPASTGAKTATPRKP
jgi:ketosteroid isomerase-like protein